MSIKSEFDNHYKRLIEICNELEIIYKKLNAEKDEMPEYFTGPFADIIDIIIKSRIEMLKTICDNFVDLSGELKGCTARFQAKMEELIEQRKKIALGTMPEGCLGSIANLLEYFGAEWNDWQDNEYKYYDK